MNAVTIRRLAFLVIALGAAVACATADESSSPPPTTDPVEGGVFTIDGAADVADAAIDTAPPTCSDAGWCTTTLPDPDLAVKDIWPVTSDHAFALVSSDSRGIRVMEWSGSAWSILPDDGSQNAFSSFTSNLWAPGPDELWFSVIDASAFFGGTELGSYVFHGTRPAMAGAAWSWSSTHFSCSTFDVTPWVWGTSKDDVYALSCGRLYHREPGADGGDGGAAGWTVAHEDRDPNPNKAARFGTLAGSSADDVWIAGVRGGRCALLLHKTPSGIATVVDGTVNAASSCVARAGLPHYGAAFGDLLATAAGTVLVTSSANDGQGVNGILRVVVQADGTAALTSASATNNPTLERVWGTSTDDLWALASSGASFVERGQSPFTDAGSFTISTIALNGAQNTHALSTLRGTSNSNIWLGGDGVAFHKTSP